MQKTSFLRKAWQVYRDRPLEVFLFLAYQLFMRAVALSPLLMLTNARCARLAWLALPLWMLLVLPARAKAAVCMQSALRGGHLFSVQLVSPAGYTGRLVYALKRAGLMLLWLLPFIAASVYMYVTINSDTDTFTLLRRVSALGGGSFKNGVINACLIYAATLLPFCVGCAFHCGSRHRDAVGEAHTHRLHCMLNWVTGLLLVLPFAVVAMLSARGYIAQLGDVLNGLMMGSFKLPNATGLLWTLAAEAAVLLLPVLPLRSLIIGTPFADSGD